MTMARTACTLWPGTLHEYVVRLLPGMADIYGYTIQ